MIKRSPINQLYRKHNKVIIFNIKFILLCIFAGFATALFSIATDKAYIWCMLMFHKLGYFTLISIPIIFIFIVFLFKKYFSYAGGSGLPQGYALDVFDEDVLHSTYSIKTMIGKAFLTFMSILGGASLGREGPTIQICASIFAMFKNISLERKKLLIRIGSGVGVATAFNAPLGGIIFAIEEYIKHSEHKMNLLLLLGIAISGYCSIIVNGNYYYMGYVKVAVSSFHYMSMIAAVIAGVICGFCGALFTWLIVKVSVNNDSVFSRWRHKHYLLAAGVFGFLVAVLGIMSSGLSFGNGAFSTKDFIDGQLNAPWYYALIKSVGAIFAVAAGVPGGYFSTALSIGAGIMDLVYKALPIIPLDQFYLLGMVAFLAAITSAPITAVAMVICIVDASSHFALPLIIASLIASYIASLFGDSVYHQQVLIYVDKDKYHATR
jgi:H+/Cl- antiporter ClcA